MIRPNDIIRLKAYRRHFSEGSFWQKLTGAAGRAGSQVLENALVLFFTLRRPDVPAWAKGVIYGALGYFILPIDAIPDIIPGIGFSDDLTALAAAMVAVAAHVTPEVRQQAQAQLRQWLGPKAA